MSTEGNASEYRVTVVKRAKRDLKKLVKALANDQFTAIDDVIKGLGINPRPVGYEPLKGQDGMFRYRVGDYRILYGIDDQTRSVKIARVRDRKDVYSH